MQIDTLNKIWRGGIFDWRVMARLKPRLMLGIGLSIALLLGSCQPVPPLQRPLGYADVRILDPVDAPLPGLDILALYIQVSASELRIRLDMLELQVEPDYDLYLAIDSRLGGARVLPQGAPNSGLVETETDIEWNLLVVLTAAGAPQVLDEALQPVEGAGLTVLRNSALDHLEIRLNTRVVRQRASGPLNALRVQAFTTLPGSVQVADRVEPAAANARPPRQGQVVLAFWNTLPAYSPGQALRRWNGAHTGPLGGRHGLGNLLWAVEETGAPVILLDLLHPASSPCLAAVDGQARLRTLTARALLSLPVVISGAPDRGSSGDDFQWALDRSRTDSLEVARRMILPAGSLGFAPQGDPGQARGLKALFLPEPSTPALTLVWPHRQGNRFIIPVAGYTQAASAPGIDMSIGEAGPSLAIRAALADLGQETQASTGALPVLLLGGDLPGSNWGDPRLAEINLRYLQSRPWIKILSPSEVLALGVEPNPAEEENNFLADTGWASLPEDFEQVQQALLKELRAAPDNPLADAAWQAYQAYYAPVWPGSPDLPALRSRYLGFSSSLLAAARWAEDPQAQAHCQVDTNGDGELECVLASETMYALFDPGRAGLLLLAARLPGGEVHQVIGPSSQFISGASDPYTWDLGQGKEADPAVISGAFISKKSTGQAQLTSAGAALPTGAQTGGYSISAASLSFTAATGDWVKTFTLQPAGLQVEYEGAGPFQVQIPLALDPWMRFSPAWPHSYVRNTTPQAWAWGIQGDNRQNFWVSVTASAPLRAQTFLDSAGYLVIPEDPNFDYPEGHFLLFPLALVEISAAGSFRVELILEENLRWPTIPQPDR